MEKGAMEGGREWCSLTWARCRPCPIVCASHRSQAAVSGVAIVVGGHSHSLVGVRFRWWAFVFIGGHSFSLVGGRFRWWGVVCIGGRSFSSVGIRFHWWGVVWCGGKPLVAGRVLPFVGVCLHWWAVVSVCAWLASLVAFRGVVAGGVVVRVRRGCYR